MRNNRRHNWTLYRIIQALIAPFMRGIFHFSHEKNRLPGPTLVVCNHVTNFDPMLVGISFPKDPMHFVASEHLFRLGWITRILCFITDPIPRRKGTSGADTAMACMRKLREGESVCIFAEGECSWDGVTNRIFPATGRMARMSNATLITFRLEGGYLTAPRWGKGIRKGKMSGRIVGVYSPEELKAMDKNAITDLIQRDIFEDTWEKQAQQPIRYRSKRRAENLQTVLYACPHCRRIGTLSSKGATLSCTCGETWEFTELGTFSPAQPFENIAQWDAWQGQLFADRMDAGKLNLSDPDMTLSELVGDHHQRQLTVGSLRLEEQILFCGEMQFPLAEISDMALVQSRMLLFSVGSHYYQIKAKSSCCLRKYVTAWKHCRETAGVAAM